MNGQLSLNAWLFAGTAVGLVALLVFAYARRDTNSGLGRRALLLATLALTPAAAALGVGWGLDEVLENPEPQGSAVVAMAVSPDGSKAATADLSGETRIYNLADGSFVAGPSFAAAMPRVAALHMLKSGADKDMLVAISDQSSFAITGTDGRQAAPAIDDAKLYLLSLATGNGLFVAEGSTAPGNVAQHSAPSSEFDVKYYDFRAAKPQLFSHLLVRPTAMAVTMPVARLQAALAAFGIKGLQQDGIIGARILAAINQFQQQNGLRVTGKVDAATIDKILELKLADIGSLQILLGFADGRIAVIDQLTQRPRTIISVDSLPKSPQTDAPTPTPRPILRIASDGAGRIATADADGHLSLWAVDPKSGQPAIDEHFQANTAIVLVGHSGIVGSAVFSPDGAIILTGSLDHSARLWDSATGAPVGAAMVHGDAVESATFAPDGNRILTASADKTARLWDSATGLPVGKVMEHGDGVNFASFSNDGKHIVTASTDRTARLWDASGVVSGQVLRHDWPVLSVTFSKDDDLILTVSDDTAARLWKTSTGSAVGAAMSHEGTIKSAKFSPDGARVVTASVDNTARLWSGLDGSSIGEPKQHDDIVFFAAFSPNGKEVVTTSEDTTARFWDGVSGTPIATSRGHSAAVLYAVFSPDGRRVATVSWDKTARLWDASNGEPIGRVMNHADVIYRAAFSPDGTRLVTASADNTARVWDAFTGLPAKTIEATD
jgi:WD40 repeat protein